MLDSFPSIYRLLVFTVFWMVYGACVWVHMHVCGCVCVGPRVNAGSLSWSLCILFIEAVSFAKHRACCWASNLVQDSVSAFYTLRIIATLIRLLHGFWDLNSGPHKCEDALSDFSSSCISSLENYQVSPLAHLPIRWNSLQHFIFAVFLCILDSNPLSNVLLGKTVFPYCRLFLPSGDRFLSCAENF